MRSNLKIPIPAMNNILLSNYHMHTTRCGHATGTDREYVEAAIRYGYRTIGFSDHTPQPFPNGFVSPVRMKCADLEGYVESVLRLKNEYRSDIKILLALEVEVIPSCFEEWQKLVSPYPFDYFLHAQHFVPNEYEGTYSMRLTDSEQVLKQYVDLSIESMQAYGFLYLAHPDLIHFADTSSEVYSSEMRRLCECAKDHNLPLEINLLGVRDHRSYPTDDFWRIAGEVGNTVVIGTDAHSPDAMNPGIAFRAAMKLIERYHLNWKQDLL